MAVETSDEVHAEAMAHADQFTREALMTSAVKQLIDDFTALKAQSTDTTDAASLAENQIVAGGPSL
jgi:hypothetical protein